jgi:hypothetical protein
VVKIGHLDCLVVDTASSKNQVSGCHQDEIAEQGTALVDLALTMDASNKSMVGPETQ